MYFRTKWIAFITASSMQIGCSGGDDEPVDTGPPPVVELDPDVPPLVEGSWARPGLRTSWQWQLVGPVVTGLTADLYVVDLDDASTTSIATIQTQGNLAFCHLSVGTRDAADPGSEELDAALVGNPVAAAPGEAWLDIREKSVRDRARARLALAEAKGCDGVVLNRLDAHLQDSGFELTLDDTLAFVRRVANAAHELGLAVAQQDAPDLVEELLDYVDLMVDQRCHEQARCDDLQPFLDAGKPVLNAEYAAEYVSDPVAFCTTAIVQGTRSTLLDEDLDNSVRISCDEDFASDGALADVQTFATYYGDDPGELFTLRGLDLAVVQPGLTTDQRATLQATTELVAYLSVGELGLDITYAVHGQYVTGADVLAANPEWFLGENPAFDSYFADAGNKEWQDFVVAQAEAILLRGYDGLFLDTVDTVDAYAQTREGMVELIERLRATFPDARIVQNRGLSILGETADSVDAVMFEAFSSRYEASSDAYVATDPAAPGSRALVESAVAYRLKGGVVLAQDFGLPGAELEELVCGARLRALLHHFVPGFADGDFQEGRQLYPSSCPWPDQPRLGISFRPSLVHLRSNESVEVRVDHAGEGGFEQAVNLSVGPFPPRILATFDATRIGQEEFANLTVSASSAVEPGTEVLPVHAAIAGDARRYDLRVVAHQESLWVAMPGLSTVLTYDEPAQLPESATPSRRVSTVVAEPTSVAVAPDGRQYVVEYVGDPDAPQPAGRVLVYAPFDGAEPATEISVGLTYPTSLAFDAKGTAWVANSGVDATGAPRDIPDISTIEPKEDFARRAFSYDYATFGYPQQLAFDPVGDLWLSTTFGLVLGFDLPVSGESATPAYVLTGASDAFDTVRDLAFDLDGDLWLSTSLKGAPQVVEVASGWWVFDPTIDDADLSARLTLGLPDPWGLAFDQVGRLWVSNRTNGAEGPGSVVRFDSLLSGSAPSGRIALPAAFAEGIAIGRP